MADPVDEFEFKPLTEGLGFHKKAETATSATRASIPLSIQLSSSSPADIFNRSLDGDIDSTAPAFALNEEIEAELLGRETSKEQHSQSISDLIASLPPSLDFSADKVEEALGSTKTMDEEPPQIFQPLAREEYKPATTPSMPTMSPGVLPAPGTKATASMPASTTGVTGSYRGQGEESYARSFPHLERRKEIRKSTEIGGLEPVAAHIGAGILDGMVVTGIGTILLVCIMLITQVNLVGLLNNAQTDGPTMFHLALLFVAVFQLYMLTARSFAGASLGEWAFDLQMGSDEDQRRAVYPVQVAWRTIVVTLTGIVVLPFLSLLFRKDLAKHLSGLQLFRKP